jgi:hypothetical protein
VTIKQGTICCPQKYVVPQNFLVYLTDRARRVAEISSQISTKQRIKIADAFRKNPERAAASETTRALDADVRMFGQGAFNFSGNSDSEN